MGLARTARRPHRHQIIGLIVQLLMQRFVPDGQAEVNSRAGLPGHALFYVKIITVLHCEPLLGRQVSHAAWNNLFGNPAQLNLLHQTCGLTEVLSLHHTIVFNRLS
jgi:hypothetical protein